MVHGLEWRHISTNTIPQPKYDPWYGIQAGVIWLIESTAGPCRTTHHCSCFLCLARWISIASFSFFVSSLRSFSFLLLFLFFIFLFLWLANANQIDWSTRPLIRFIVSAVLCLSAVAAVEAEPKRVELNSIGRSVGGRKNNGSIPFPPLLHLRWRKRSFLFSIRRSSDIATTAIVRPPFLPTILPPVILHSLKVLFSG